MSGKLTAVAAPERPPTGTGAAATLGELVDLARGRIERQAAYAALAAKGGAGARVLADGLRQAGACVMALARPHVVQLPLAATAAPQGVIIAGRIAIANSALGDDLAGGGALGATLTSLGYGQEESFAWLGRDYMLHHLQTELARETLFAVAREADRAALRRRPGWRLHRISVTAGQACGRRHLWDPAQIQALLALFEPDHAGVSLTETGFFQPLHSLLGLTMLRPPQGPQGVLS